MRLLHPRLIALIGTSFLALSCNSTVKTDADACPSGVGGYPAQCCDQYGNLIAQCTGYVTTPGPTTSGNVTSTLDTINQIGGSSGTTQGTLTAVSPIFVGGPSNPPDSTSSSSGSGADGGTDGGTGSTTTGATSAGADGGAGSGTSSSSGASTAAATGVVSTGVASGVGSKPGSGINSGGAGTSSTSQDGSLLGASTRFLASLWQSAASDNGSGVASGAGSSSSGSGSDGGTVTPAAGDAGTGTTPLSTNGGGATTVASAGDASLTPAPAGNPADATATGIGGGVVTYDKGGSGHSAAGRGQMFNWNNDESVDTAALESAGFKHGDVGTMIGVDPADYFARLDIRDSLFKKVERRYQQKSMQWSLSAADTGAAAARTLAGQNLAAPPAGDRPRR